jgi:hypothetical protein
MDTVLVLLCVELYWGATAVEVVFPIEATAMGDYVTVAGHTASYLRLAVALQVPQDG